MDLTRLAFHIPILWSMRSAIVPMIRLGFYRFWAGHWNQFECCIGMSLPFPIHHLPSFSFGLSCLIKFPQNQEWWDLGSHSWIEHLGKYLALKVLVTRDWRFWLILQNCLASIAWFMRLNFLKPMPPSFLFWHILSQWTKCSLLTPYSCPHQKFLMTESNLLQIVLGTLKQEKV